MAIPQRTGDRRMAVDILFTAATGRMSGEPLDCAACGTRHPRRCLVDFTPGPDDPRHLLAALGPRCEGAGSWADLKRAEQRIGEQVPRKLRLPDRGGLLILVVDPDWTGGEDAA